ncbi:MAG: DedA family protein [Thermoleophilaceae bacterium]|nr:DedA family protein [Thermoleophilaceae bacterium]
MFDWITGLVEATGYVGILLLMLVENVFPPIPSELIMPLAGFTAAQGRLSLALVVLAGTAGSLLGALFWYALGRWLGADRLKRFAARHGRWLTLSPVEVDRAEAWFQQHGAKAVLLGRLVPGVRSLISVPAGVTGMKLPGFLAWTALGTGLWTALLAGAGYALQGQYALVADYVNPASNVVVGLLFAWYAYRVATFRPEAARVGSTEGTGGLHG